MWLVAAGLPAHAAPVPVPNATQFKDTTGAAVHAHGGGAIKVGNLYYWFGENRHADNTFKAVSVYRSTDLKTWEFRKDVLTQESDPELAVANIERPKVIYNSQTRKFVLWMHKENGKDYTESRTAVAVSDTVDGDFAWKGSFRPPSGTTSRDMTLFKEGGTVNDSQYVWSPLAFPTRTTMSLPWYPQLSVDTDAGTVRGAGGGPHYTLAARHSGKCLDVADESTGNGARLVQWTCGTGANQQFHRTTA